VFRVAGTGARWAGGRAATLLLLFSVLGGAVGTSAAVLGPGLPVASSPLSARPVTMAALGGCWP